MNQPGKDVVGAYCLKRSSQGYGPLLFLAGGLALLVLAGAQAGGSSSPGDTSGGAFGKYVDSKGNITLPTGYVQNWVHLGTVVADDLSDGSRSFHSTYTPLADLLHFQKSGRFADGAILVKEIRDSRSGQLTSGKASWAGAIKIRFVMIKDDRGRFADNSLWGNGWGWALFDASKADEQTAKNYKKDCLVCHVPAQKTDWVYVDKYPALGSSANLPTIETKEFGSGPSTPPKAQLRDGKALFARCAGCHSLKLGENEVGPSLFGVVGRRVGSVPDYEYSQAMKNADIAWTKENLNKHLADVPGFIPGNDMAKMFPRGVPDPAEREALIDYLDEIR